MTEYTLGVCIHIETTVTDFCENPNHEILADSNSQPVEMSY